MNNTTEHEQPYEVIELGPLNFGNPDAGISLEKHKNEELFEQMRDKSIEIIKNGWAMTDITELDDGCFDGRETEGLAVLDEEGQVGNREIDKPHEKPMLAGGGYGTSVPIVIALGERSQSVDMDYASVPLKLKDKKIICGAHRAAAHGEETCGCGALDRQPQILQNGVTTYAEPIKETTRALTEVVGLTFSDADYEAAMDEWEKALKDEAYFGESTGDSRSKTIMATQDVMNQEAGESLGVTKNLKGAHNEWFLTINTRSEKTFSQRIFKNLMMHHFPGVDEAEFPQVFPLDAPRIGELATALADDEGEVVKGVQAGVAYQLGTAAELTDGTLPVYVIK